MTSGEELIEPVTASQLAEAVDLVASNGARAWGTREIDLSAVREFLRREQLKTPEHLPALFVVWVRASCEALAQVPLLNSRWTDDGIRAFKFVNLGIEVPTGRGRVVPVVKDADQLALQDLADALADLVQRAAAGYVSEKEISGGTFTSNFISRSESRSFGSVIIFMYLQKAIRLASMRRALGAASCSG